MREVIAISTILVMLAIAGAEAEDHAGAKSCVANFLVTLVDGC
jgi:hypothetical protein